MQDISTPKTILLLCSNIPLTKLIQNSVKQIPQVKLILRNDFLDAKYILTHRYIDLIIQCPLHNNIVRENPTTLHIPTITLTDKKDSKILREYFKAGTDYILPIPFSPQFLTLLIQKACGLIRDHIKDEIRYHNLILLPNQNILKYKETRIDLTTNEKHLIKLILENNFPIQSHEIYKYISNKCPDTITEKQIYTTISRLNRKFKKNTGLTLLRNKYGVGYYITI